MDYPAWKFWIDAAQLGGLCAIGIYTWWTNREKVTNRRFQDHEDRIIVLEITAKNAPVCQHHGELAHRIEDIHGDLRELSGSVNGVKRAVDLMNEFLINQGSNKR